jgi:hypothetical protein
MDRYDVVATQEDGQQWGEYDIDVAAAYDVACGWYDEGVSFSAFNVTQGRYEAFGVLTQAYGALCQGWAPDGVPDDHVDFVTAADLCPQCDGESVEIRVNGTFLHLMCADPENCHEPEAARCHHGIDVGQCVTCTGKRDEFASYRKADGEGRHVKPYAELPATVRGAFGIGQVRDVVPSSETATRQWTDAPCDTEWASGADPDAPAYVNPEAKRGDTVPLWYRVMVRGATAPWPDPNTYDRGKYLASVKAAETWGKVDRPAPGRYVRGLVLAPSGRGRGEVDVTAWRASAKHRNTYVSTFNMDDHIPAR